jgi:hypothetical protein
MTSGELQAQADAGNVSQEESPPTTTTANTETAASPQSPGPQPAPVHSMEQYIPVVVSLQSTQKYLSAAPTFVPQTFQDQIQFVFDGTTYWLYFYANNKWNALEVSTPGSYGDGSDGNVILDGSTTFGFASLSSNVYTLNRDIFCSALTINATVTLKPNGFKVYSQSPINVGGIISVNGGNGGAGANGQSTTGPGQAGTGGTGGTKGAGIPSGSIKQPGDGVAGTVGMTAGITGSPNTKNGANGIAETNCILPNNAANGGDSASGAINGATGFTNNKSTGGLGGTATRTTKPSSLDIIRSLLNAIGSIGCNPTPGSGAGGGGGYGNNPGNDSSAGGGGGGGSGAPGGIAWLCAPAINILPGGSITSKGGDGGRGGDGGTATGGISGNWGGGGGGGGAPGNGGLILLITPSFTNQGTITANAGTPGNGGTGASAGQSASNGQIVQIVP